MINMKKNIRMVPFRRKREGKTNYDRRIKLLKSNQIRLLVSYGSKDIRAQAIKFNLKGDEVLADANAKSLKGFGWDFSCSNLPASYLFGYYFGKLLIEKGISTVIFDTGIVTPKSGGKYYSFAKGIIDSKVSMDVNPDVFPSEERIKGAHIESYSKLLKENGLYDTRYSAHLKLKADAEKIKEAFDKVLEKIKQAEKLSKMGNANNDVVAKKDNEVQDKSNKATDEGSEEVDEDDA